MEPSILLTGASGFVGLHCANWLLRRGYHVTALDKSAGSRLPKGVEFLHADLADPSSLLEVPRRWWGVIHLAAISVPGQFTGPAPILTNLQITINLLEHLEEARVLLVSSCHVYAPANTPRNEDALISPKGRYGLSKHLCEQLLPHYQNKLDLRVARPFNHLGPGMPQGLMIPTLLRRLNDRSKEDLSPVIMQGMNSVRDFIDVRDVVSGYLAILEMDDPVYRTFNVCTGQGRCIEEVVTEALNLIGTPRTVCFENNTSSTDDTPYLVGDPARLRDYTGWRAIHSLTDSLGALLQLAHS